MSDTWTYTMAYDDVKAMLISATPGQSISEWRNVAAAASRFSAAGRRKTQLQIAAALLCFEEGLVADTDFINDLRIADDVTARDLVYGRYLASKPLALGVARTLFRVATESERRVTPIQLDEALRQLLPNAKASTLKRSRSALLTEFARAGIISPDRSGGFTILRKRPALSIVYHLLKGDLDSRREASDEWISRFSIPAILYVLSPEQINSYVNELVEAGRLRRSYYAGEPRILAA